MLSMGTVFHEIILKKPERTTTLVDIKEDAEQERQEEELNEEEDKEVPLYENSDEEWDTDLEDAGKWLSYTYIMSGLGKHFYVDCLLTLYLILWLLRLQLFLLVYHIIFFLFFYSH